MVEGGVVGGEKRRDEGRKLANAVNVNVIRRRANTWKHIYKYVYVHIYVPNYV